MKLHPLYGLFLNRIKRSDLRIGLEKRDVKKEALRLVFKSEMTSVIDSTSGNGT